MVKLDLPRYDISTRPEDRILNPHLYSSTIQKRDDDFYKDPRFEKSKEEILEEYKDNKFVHDLLDMIL